MSGMQWVVAGVDVASIGAGGMCFGNFSMVAEVLLDRIGIVPKLVL
jgi:hypothetical protein